MHAGVERLSLRWALALAATYLVYLILLRLWCGWLLSRDEGDVSLDGLDLPGIGSSPAPGEAGNAPVSSGGGGDFGGGGASASFDAGAAGDVGSGGGDVAGGVIEAAGSADEGIVILVPLAIVIGVAVMIASGLGVLVFGLFGVEILLGVAVEIAFAAAGGALAFRARREGWLPHAAARSAMPMLAIALLCVTLGAAIDHWLPAANSLPQALRALQG